MGAWVGDSLGSYLEFETEQFPPETLDLAMSMPGGGCWGVAPGQVTDDSELAMCLMRGLIAGGGALNLKEICRMYGKWANGGIKPFDIGTTTRKTLGLSDPENPDPSTPQLAATSVSSQSDGSLMRCMPMAVWCHRLPVEQVPLATQCDVKFTHSMPHMANLISCYTIGIWHLLNGAAERRIQAF